MVRLVAFTVVTTAATAATAVDKWTELKEDIRLFLLQPGRGAGSNLLQWNQLDKIDGVLNHEAFVGEWEFTPMSGPAGRLERALDKKLMDLSQTFGCVTKMMSFVSRHSFWIKKRGPVQEGFVFLDRSWIPGQPLDRTKF